jgi:hypothetical protein
MKLHQNLTQIYLSLKHFLNKHSHKDFTSHEKFMTPQRTSSTNEEYLKYNH